MNVFITLVWLMAGGWIYILYIILNSLSDVTATVEHTEIVVNEDRSSDAEICANIHGKHEIKFQIEVVPSGGNATG